jgi:hypothetical protein
MFQRHLLDEDLFQVSYSDKFTIDVGWYPAFKKNGSFRIVVIEDYDWENPIYDKRCRDLKTLNLYMEECVEMVKGLLEK